MNNSSKILIAFFAGFAAGTVTGLMIAPDEGSKTRENLSKKGKKLWKKTKKSADEFVKKSADLKDKVVKEGKEIFE
ncbi:YtxH domain-containing protein [Segetibacter koreensis]|uniref:YtxH domain-containing protein n=1 Tax=Segetibacter koreensis TaxID=398037 RepID=UPI00037578CE|nr:YtxH domain-containing protein [Segetibacter koreensis]